MFMGHSFHIHMSCSTGSLYIHTTNIVFTLLGNVNTILVDRYTAVLKYLQAIYNNVD